jgi:16S rRNA (uracil1498-N3)-methyltransferase
MRRFFLPPERCAGAVMWLDGREAQHALHVLRLKPGDGALVLDGAGRELVCDVKNCSHDSLSLAVRETRSTPLPACVVTLLVGIPKGKIIEDIIQKSVELGVRRVVPLLTERVVTRLDARGGERKREHWQQVAIEAIKQCGALWLPEIAAPTTIWEVRSQKAEGRSESVREVQPSAFSLQPSAFELSLVGSLQAERRHPREVFREFEKANGRLPQAVAVWVGPEGDFTPDELRAIQETGAQLVSLGPLTLRVETAAIYCLSILNYELRRD